MEGERMRQLTASLAIAAIGVLVVACSGNNQGSPASSTKTTTTTTPTTPTQPPVAPAALPNVLLSPAEIDGVLGLTGTTSKQKNDKLFESNEFKQMMPPGWQFPDECLYAFGPAQTSVYAGSGNTAVSVDDDSPALPAGSNDKYPVLNQAAVLFPSVNEANAFFTASSQRWQACSDRQVTPPANPDNLLIDFKVGPVSNENATLTTTLNLNLNSPVPGGAPISNSCQRALTVRNNVAIDVNACSNTGLAVNVANQIAGKVDSANNNLLAGSLSKGYGPNNCQPVAATKLTGLVLAELDCGQSPDPVGPASAIYRLLPQADALASDFKSMIQGMALTACGPNTGDSPGKWQQGQTSGQMACGTEKDVATLTWTTDGKNALGSIRASNADVNALHQWWLANG
jgi:PknH-like extracellular domain